MITLYQCLFIYCVTMQAEVRECTYVIEPPNKANTSRMVDYIAAGGKAYSVCGTEKEIKDSIFYKELMKGRK